MRADLHRELQRAVRPMVVAVALLIAGIGMCPHVRAEDFLSVLDDMPLMPGLTELRDQAADFQTPSGRIIDGSATGSVDARAVSSFYDRTLPSLGWTREGPGRFVRDRERLAIAVGSGGPNGGITVRFSVRPQGVSAGR